MKAETRNRSAPLHPDQPLPKTIFVPSILDLGTRMGSCLNKPLPILDEVEFDKIANSVKSKHSRNKLDLNSMMFPKTSLKKEDQVCILYNVEDKLFKIGDGTIFKVQKDRIGVCVSSIEDCFDTLKTLVPLPMEVSDFAIECRSWMCVEKSVFEETIARSPDYKDANDFLVNNIQTTQKEKKCLENEPSVSAEAYAKALEENLEMKRTLQMLVIQNNELTKDLNSFRSELTKLANSMYQSIFQKTSVHPESPD